MGDVIVSGAALAVIVPLVISLAGVVSLLFKLLLLAKDDRMKDIKSERDSYKEIAEEAVAKMEKVANERLKLAGQPHFTPLAPVVPEHNSPTTEAQQEAADLQTMRARLVASDLILGFPARKAAPPTGREKADGGAEHVIDREAAIQAIRDLPEVEGVPFPLPERAGGPGPEGKTEAP